MGNEETLYLTAKNPKSSWSALERKWKLIILVILGLCIVFASVLGAVAVIRGTKVFVRIDPGCESSFPLDLEWPKDPRVFQDLNEHELRSVRNYLFSVKALGLVEYDKAKLSDNFIYLIELYIPSKAAVLGFLDKKGPKPTRHARVVIFHGAEKTPYVEEYLVYPVAKPEKHEKLRRAGIKYPIPYYARPQTSLEKVFTANFLLAACRPAKDIIEESFGGFRALDCGDKCLVPYEIGFPGSKKPNLRQSWYSLARSVEGIDLNIVPMAFLLDHTDGDVKNWKIVQVYYNNQLFTSVADLVSKYSSGKVKKCNFTFSEDQLYRTTLRKRGKSFLKTPLRGPELVEPNGRRFSVSGQKVKYMPWEFEFGIKASKSLSLFNVKFNNRRILYELSIQDAVSFYSSGDPVTSVSNYLDNFLGMAKDTLELLQGVDCPFTAVYADNILMTQGDSPKRIRNCICIYETTQTMAARRHRGWTLYNKIYGPKVDFEYISGLVDYALVIRAITIAENYDYIFDYILHLNGVIEVRTTAAGYLATTPYYSSDDDFGFVNFYKTKGPVHDHMVLYKADLDVDGTQNSHLTLDITKRHETTPWDKTWNMTKKVIQRNYKKTELDARFHYNFDKPKYYVFQNPNVKNPYGYPVAYRVQFDSPVKQVYDADYYVTKACQWSKYQMAVTKHKDNEQFGSSVYNVYGMENPVFHFDSYLNDNESITNEDLVSWITVGGLHIPNTEDIPTTFSTGNTWKFLIRPFGFFQEDPTMGSTDAVYVTPTKDRQKCCIVETYGTPEGSSCHVPKRTFHYTGQ